MKDIKKILAKTLMVLILISISAYSMAQDKKVMKPVPVIRFGTLPVVQALPLFVASEKGYYTQQGIDVELIPFNSALEKDVAITAGGISGYFGDMMTPIVLNANGVPVRMVATIFNSTGRQRTFAILASPKSSGRTLRELVEAGIAGSSNTIIEYITGKILSSHNIQAEKLNMIETKNIPIRLQMLLSNQTPSATLPEPLVTLAELKGARVMADDAGRGISPIILAFHLEFLKTHPYEVRNFIVAVDKAISFINKNPEEVRSIMNRYCRIPKPLQKSFAILKFPEIKAPDYRQVMDVYNWLRGKGIINAEMNYTQMVSDECLP